MRLSVIAKTEFAKEALGYLEAKAQIKDKHHPNMSIHYSKERKAKR